MAWVLDLDGVVWLAEQPIAGAAAAVAALRSQGEAVVFVTNNSAVPRNDVAVKLAGMGIEPGDDVVTSAMAAARLLVPGERVLVCGGAGIEHEVRARGCEIVAGRDADVVLVGLHRSFDYAGLERASTAVRRGARLIGTNDDATYPTPAGPIPGGGAILAAVATAAGVEPVIAGKPHAPMADLVRERLGPDGVVVGDRPSTDGGFARRLGYRFALVLSGVTDAADVAALTPAPDVVADDLAGLVRDGSLT